MKKFTANSNLNKQLDLQPLSQLSKLLGKRLRSTVLINNLSKVNLQEDIKEEQIKSTANKRVRTRKEQELTQEGGIQSHSKDSQRLLKQKLQAKLANPIDLYPSISASTFSDEHRHSASKYSSQENDETESLTASDFEALNSENFFDKINNTFIQLTQNRNSLLSSKSLTEHKIKSAVSNQMFSVTDLFLKQNYELEPLSGMPKVPAFCKNVNYADEYWNIFLHNQSLLAQIDRLASDRNELLMKNLQIETFYDQNMERLSSERYSSGRKKHNRRCANDVERSQKCPYPKCEKFYGSEGSLNLHIKIKHGGGNKTDREKIAKSIVFAKANGINIPEQLDVNLPPGSVEKAAQQVGIRLDEESLKRLEDDLSVKNEQNVKKMKELEMMKTLTMSYGGQTKESSYYDKSLTTSSFTGTLSSIKAFGENKQFTNTSYGNNSSLLQPFSDSMFKIPQPKLVPSLSMSSPLQSLSKSKPRFEPTNENSVPSLQMKQKSDVLIEMTENSKKGGLFKKPMEKQMSQPITRTARRL